MGLIPRLDCLLTPGDVCSSPHPRYAGPLREASGLGPRARANALGRSCSREANRRRLVYIRDKRGEWCSFRNPTSSSSTPSLSAAPPFDPLRSHTQMASLPESWVRGDVLQDVQNLGPDVLVLWEGGSAGVP